MAANASVQVDAADGFGILITNGEFTAFVDPNFGQQVCWQTAIDFVSLQLYLLVRRLNSSTCDIV